MGDGRDVADVELSDLKRQEGRRSLDADEIDIGEHEAFLEDGKREGEGGGGQNDVASSTLSWREKKNWAILFGLYFIQAVPLTFSWVTMPVLLRQQFDYSVVGTYIVCNYPYAVKVLWAPVVQSKYIAYLGRRKTWIVPSFLVGGLLMFWLAFHQDETMIRVSTTKTGTLFWIFAAWFLITVSCATLRIALDDWSLDLFTPPNLHWASTALTCAELSGFLLSFNLFLGVNSLENPDSGAKGEEASTRFYFLATATTWGVVALVVLLTQRDSTTRIPTGNTPVPGSRTDSAAQPPPTLLRSYGIVWRILSMPHIRTLMAIHMTSMVGFLTNDSIALLQLVKYSFTDRDIASLATLSSPLELLGGYLVTRTFRRHHPWHVWRTLFPFRLANAVLMQLAVLAVSTPALQRDDRHLARWLLVLLPGLASRQFENMMFICLVSFHVRIADRRYGGIYLPLLATTLSMRYDVIGFVYTKLIAVMDGGEGPDTAPSSRGLIDGYQIMNTVTVLVAIPLFLLYLIPRTRRLEHLPRNDWLVKGVEENADEDDDRSKDDPAADDGDDDDHHHRPSHEPTPPHPRRKGGYQVVPTAGQETEHDDERDRPRGLGLHMNGSAS